MCYSPVRTITNKINMNTQQNSAFNKLGLIVAIITENTPKEETPVRGGFPSDQQEQETTDNPDRDNVENLPDEHEQPDVLPLERENPDITHTEENIPEEKPEIEKPDEAPVPDIDETVPHTDREEDTHFSAAQQHEKQANMRDEDDKSIDNTRNPQGFDADLG